MIRSPTGPMLAGGIRRIRLLLVNPRFPESFWSFQWALDHALKGKRALNPPLGLATLAALCPPHWDVEIVDENVEPIPLAPAADLIGICGMGVQFRRQSELLAHYREAGYFVVAGGSFASLCPERYADLADCVVSGEAEDIWPAFCKDFDNGRVKTSYREEGTVELQRSPTPRYDLLKLDRYTSVAMQFSRGCPFRCDFCDIIVMFGRRPRCKSLDQIGAELDLLRALGARSVFFVDDNLIGDRPAAKRLLAYLAQYQRRHGYAFNFGTEASINLADDEALLAGFQAANFSWVFIGIESPDAESLKETRKTQNTRGDLLASVRRIHAAGIDVLAGFIVGFDNDTLATFDRQYRFIEQSGIQAAMVGLLTALPKTPLHRRLEAEGRLLPDAAASDNTRPGTNFLPRRMDYQAMVDAYKALYWRLVGERAIFERIRAKARHLRRPVDRGSYRPLEAVGIVARLLGRGILPGGARRAWWFARSFAAASPRVWHLVVTDWIVGLSMRSYVQRHFRCDPASDERRLASVVALIERTCRRCLQRGHLEIGRSAAGEASALALTLNGFVDRAFFTRVGRGLDRMLRRSTATLTLHIESLHATQHAHLQLLLARLSRHRGRVAIRIGESLRPWVAIDLTAFHLILDPRAPAMPR